MILFGPALFLGRVLLSADILSGLPGRPPAERLGNPLQMDVVTQIVPLEASVRRALGSGGWPLWNSSVGAGMPLLADPQAQALQPLVALAWPLPLASSLVVTAGLKVLLPLVFLFLVLRRIGVGESAALFGALSFALSGSVLLWLGWPMSSSAAWLPMLLYAVLISGERGARRDGMLLTAALAGALLAGHPETTLYAVGTALALALALFLRRARSERPALVRRWALSAALAFGLAAPILLPAASYLPQSQRSALLERRNLALQRNDLEGDDDHREGVSSWHRIRESLAPWIAPPRPPSDVRGQDNRNENAMGFAGTFAWIGAVLAILVPSRRRLPFERLFLAFLILSLAITARPPGIERLLAPLPIVGSSATWHHRLLLLVALSVSIVAACAFDRLLAGGPRRSRLLLLLAPLAGLELAATFRGDNPSLPQELFYPQSPALAFLQAHVAPGERIAGLADRLAPNSATLYGLDDVRISNPMKPFRYTQAIAPLLRSVRDTEDVVATAEHPLEGLLGVRYVLALPKMKRSEGQHAAFLDPDSGVRIFARDPVLGRLFLPARTEVGAPAGDAAWLAQNPDFAALARVSPTSAHPTAWSAAQPDASRLDLTLLQASRVQAHLLLAEERLVASSVFQDEEWAVLADGAPVAATHANGPFLAAWLPTGEHRLEALYRPAGWIAGMLLAGLALGVGVAVWVPRPARAATGGRPYNRTSR